MDFADKIRRRILYSHVREDEDGLVLSGYLARNFSRFDRENWRKEILSGKVEVNGKRPNSPEIPLKRHDRIAYFPGEGVEPEVALDCKVLYADENLLVAEKPAGLCIHPTGIFFRHTMWNILGREYGELHFISRLDRETSGLVLAARNKKAAAKMDGREFSMRKEYLALVLGNFDAPVRARGFLIPDTESVLPFKRRWVPADSLPPGTPPPGEYADTEIFSERAVPPDMTLVRTILHTGRRHQIRATLFSLGFPVAGDKLYGPDERLFLKIKDNSFTPEDDALLRFDRQALHASKIEFRHPFTGEEMLFESPFPLDA